MPLYWLQFWALIIIIIIIIIIGALGTIPKDWKSNQYYYPVWLALVNSLSKQDALHFSFLSQD